MSLRVRFGKRLQELRRMKGMTQEELAAASVLSVGFIRTVEQGVYAPSFDSIEQLAKALDVSIGTLFDLD